MNVIAPSVVVSAVQRPSTVIDAVTVNVSPASPAHWKAKLAVTKISKALVDPASPLSSVLYGA